MSASPSRMPGGFSNWNETALWAELARRGSPTAESVRTELKQCMPLIQQVLTQGGNAPPDFTLHDSEHAFRVAQMMVEIIPSDVLPLLSPYELALLLLSAYLHDIGMTPARRQVDRHRQYLLSGDPQDLTSLDLEAFQRWLDEQGDGLVPPLGSTQPTVDILRKADTLITYYCRHRHNDWSGEWIRERLSDVKLASYVTWQHDLIVLCQSHHFGYSELVKPRFNPCIVGHRDEVVHLRYLAAVLRVADILEFDPERTPEVVLNHRGIASSSLIYWWKDHQVSMTREGAKLVIAARPVSALMHRAIDQMINDIERELEVCRRLADETHFEKCPGLEKDLPHRWDYPHYVYREITPCEGAYEYIDGGFRPNTSRLLELLSGVQLYGDEMAAVRELLQNAFDACREQIALERLNSPEPASLRRAAQISALHRITLHFEPSLEGGELICTDSGIGMTRAIIRDRLLVSGSGRRKELVALERRCRAAGFSLERTGQFGIGVLSYFMLADQVTLLTRRNQIAEDAEGTGWRFETEGIGSFGELRADRRGKPGTEVRFRLRPGAIGGDPAAWYCRLRSYLKKQLVHVPCQVQLTTSLSEQEPLSLEPGFTGGRGERLALYRHELDPTQMGIVMINGTARRQISEAEEQEWQRLWPEVEQAVRWEVDEGELPGGLGHYRLHLPWFDLPGGAALAFLQARREGKATVLGTVWGRIAYVPAGHQSVSWKGVACSADQMGTAFGSETTLRRVITDISWTSSEAGRLSVNRETLELLPAGKEALRWLANRVESVYAAFLNHHPHSLFAALNHRLLGKLTLPAKPHWLCLEPDGNLIRATWAPVRFPAMNYFGPISPVSPPRDSRAIARVPLVSCFGRGALVAEHFVRGLRCLAPPPDQVFFHQLALNVPEVVGLWRRPPEEAEFSPFSRFPPAWPLLCGITVLDPSYPPTFKEVAGQSAGEPFSRMKLIWNPKHPLLRTISSATPEDWNELQSCLQGTNDPLPHREIILSRPSWAAIWSLKILARANINEWERLKVQDPSFLTELWTAIFPRPAKGKPAPEALCLWEQGEPGGTLHVISPQGWRRTRHPDEILRYLPDPGPEWRIPDPQSIQEVEE